MSSNFSFRPDLWVSGLPWSSLVLFAAGLVSFRVHLKTLNNI